MNDIPKLRIATLALLFGLALAAHASAAITVLDLYELGDDDPGALDGLLGNATTVDAAGTNDLPRTGSPTYTDDTVALGSTLAVDFNGVDQRYSVTPEFLTTTNNFGLEAWVQSDSTAGNAVIAFNGSTGPGGWGFFRNGGNYRVLFGGVGWVGDSPVTVGKWDHLALVRDSGMSTFYVNGSAVGTSSADPRAPTSGGFMIGGNVNGLEQFDGQIDRVRVFSFNPGEFDPQNDLALQSLQVLGRYQLGERDAGAGAGLPGASITVDDTGTLDLNRSGAPAYTSDTPGPGSQLAMDFSGTAGEVYANSPLLTTAQDNWIIEAWANADNTAGNAVVAYNGDTSTGGFGLFRFGDRWGGLFGGVALLNFDAPVELDEWTHLALVRESGTTQMYVDGELVAGSFTNTPTVPSGSFMIGGNPGNPPETFLGQIDDVRLSLFTGAFDPSMLGINAALVPEPSTLALAGLGLVGLLAAGRRRRRRAG